MSVRVDDVRLEGLAPLHRGAEVTVRGLGRCRFAGAVVDDAGKVLWVDVHDSRNGGLHSIRAWRVMRVHRTTKLRASA